MDIQDLRTALGRRGIDVGVSGANLVVAHTGNVDGNDLERFWRAVEALHLQA